MPRHEVAGGAPLAQDGDAAATEIHANCAVVKTKRIPPVSREDL